MVLNEAWLSSLRVTLYLASGTAIAATFAGVLVALGHMRHGSSAPPIRLFMSSPLAVPHIIVATGLFSILLYAGEGLGSIWVLIAVNAAVALPLVLAALLPAFESLDPQLWTAASTLGARPLRIIFSIVLPSVGTGIVAACLLAFHSAWDETTFAVFIGPTVVPVLSSRVFAYLQQNVTPEVAAVATLLLVMSLVAALAIAVASSRSNRPT